MIAHSQLPCGTPVPRHGSLCRTHRLRRLAAKLALPLILAACGGGGSSNAESPPPPVPLETGAGTIQGFQNYSYEKNSVILPSRTSGQVAFFDAVQPFDTTLRWESVEPTVRHRLDHPTRLIDGVLMVSLADLRKIYAPYFSYAVNANLNTFEVTHHRFGRRVTAGAGTRAPTMEYTRQVATGSYSLNGRAATTALATHATTTSINQIDSSAVASSTGPRNLTLAAQPRSFDGRIFVPVASFMASLGKTITDDTAGSGYLAISDVAPGDTADDLFNPLYAGTFSYQPLGAGRVAYMDAVRSGTRTHGNLWESIHLGDTTVFTGNYDGSGNDITETLAVDRVLPYRVYVPAGYQASVPNRFTFNLHGATGNENAVFERYNDHLVNQPPTISGVVTLEDHADHYGYIIASPNGWTRNPQWGRGPAEKFMTTIHERVKAEYNIDARKTFIFGNSLGGAGAMNYAIRHPQLFRAMAPTAPAPGKPAASQIVGPVLDMPTWLACFTEDITVPYAGASGNCQPWFQANVATTLRNVTFTTIENGHHSYGPSSTFEMMFDFFERVLQGSTPRDVASVSFQANQLTATLTDSGNAVSSQTLLDAPYLQAGVLMVSLRDLARVYGAADFKSYNVHAYNQVVADMVSVKTVAFNKTTINLKPGSNYMRVGGTVKEGDTTGASTRVPAGSPTIDTRSLSVPVQEVGGEVFVPVTEVMQLFGKTAVSL